MSSFTYLDALVASYFLLVTITAFASLANMLFASCSRPKSWAPVTDHSSIDQDSNPVLSADQESPPTHNNLHRIGRPGSGHFVTPWGIVGTSHALTTQANVLQSQIPTWTKQRLRSGQRLAFNGPVSGTAADSDEVSGCLVGAEKQESRKDKKPVYHRIWSRREECSRLHSDEDKGRCGLA